MLGKSIRWWIRIKWLDQKLLELPIGIHSYGRWIWIHSESRIVRFEWSKYGGKIIYPSASNFKHLPTWENRVLTEAKLASNSNHSLKFEEWTSHGNKVKDKNPLISFPVSFFIWAARPLENKSWNLSQVQQSPVRPRTARKSFFVSSKLKFIFTDVLAFSFI